MEGYKIGWFSPSYKRPQKSITQIQYPMVTLVVMESEVEAYEKNGNRVVSCPDEIQGNLCRVRNWILNKFKKDYDVIMLMDDDFIGLYRFNKQEIYKMSDDDVLEWAENAFIMCMDADIKLFGVNPANDKGGYREHTPFSFLGYIGGPISGHIMKDNPLRYDESLPLKEDYDMTLQHLLKYRKVLRFNMIHYQVKQAIQEGGCAVYRNTEEERRQFELLEKKWGNRIITKDNQSLRGFDFNPILKIPIKGV
jgi:hypothetical protein